MKTQKQQQFEDWDYHVRNKPQTKLYEAAKKLADSLYEWLSQQRYGNESLLHVSVCCDFVGMQRFKKALQQQIISAYEQEQPEAIARDKTIIEIWKEWCEKDISWTDAALGAMRDFASQQTSAKDKEIAELKQRISAIKEKLPDNKIRDLNPIWVRDEIISELEKQK